MQKNHGSTVAAIIALQVIAGIGTVAAHADSRQDNKNLWRNATIGSSAVALYGLAKHKDTLTIAGAAGAIYSGMRYEDDRRSQSQQSHSQPRAYYHGNGGEWRHHDRGRHEGWYRHHGHGHHHGEDCR
jgi:hypothetical protein